MSAGMAEVIAAHTADGFWEAPEDEMDAAYCSCGFEVEAMGKAKELQAAHVAEELAKAGYGNVQDAKASSLREVSESPEALERARRRIEDELIEWRDSGMSMLGRNNGLTVKGKDGSPSTIIRFGFEDGFRLALEAEAELQVAVNDPEGHALVKAIHDRKAEA